MVQLGRSVFGVKIFHHHRNKEGYVNTSSHMRRFSERVASLGWKPATSSLMASRNSPSFPTYLQVLLNWLCLCRQYLKFGTGRSDLYSILSVHINVLGK